MEIILFLDESLASYLPVGSISLIYYANRFMGIPLGAFATAFSTILLPQFARISSYAPSRLSFYLYESTKLIFWVTVPITILMIYFADKIFITLFLSSKFPMTKVIEAQYILIAFLLGLFFFSLNKILTNIYYSMHDTLRPTIISVISLLVNLILNFILMGHFKATGLAIAMSLSLGLLQTILLISVLIKKYKFTIYPKHLVQFLAKYIFQLILTFTAFLVIYKFFEKIISSFPVTLSKFFLVKIGFWLWVGPLCLILFYFLYKTKKSFGVRLYFLE
jgi:putative peptidoglycan lipid II flippase